MELGLKAGRQERRPLGQIINCQSRLRLHEIVCAYSISPDSDGVSLMSVQKFGVRCTVLGK